MIILTIVLIICGLCLAYYCGYMRGLANREIDISVLGASWEEALAWLLDHEIDRHRGDIARAKEDRKKLNVATPRMPLDMWINVRGKR